MGCANGFRFTSNAFDRPSALNAFPAANQIQPTSSLRRTKSTWYPNAVAPANFAQLANGYMVKHGINRDDLKRALVRVSVKSHANGALNPKAHLRKTITEEQVLNAPIVAEPLGLFDCCGVSDGAAACHT